MEFQCFGTGSVDLFLNLVTKVIPDCNYMVLVLSRKNPVEGVTVHYLRAVLTVAVEKKKYPRDFLL